MIDIDPRTGAQVMRYYAFDCLVLNGENIMKKPLVKRFAVSLARLDDELTISASGSGSWRR